MATAVWIDGKLFGQEDAHISVFDRGFLYGDSVYEVTRTFSGKPFLLEEHLERLEGSARGIGLELPGRDVIVRAIAEALDAGRNPESYIRIVVTRGAGDIGLDPALADRPRLIVIARQVEGPTSEMYRQGVEVAVVSVTRNLKRAIDPRVKSGNYLNNVLAIAEAKRRGAYEALMCDLEGRLAECSSSNIFFVRAGQVVTPALEVGILHGITRRKVIEICERERIPVAEVALVPADIRAMQEAFLTSSIRGVLPVVRVDGQAVGEGKPGPITQRILKGYDDLARGVSK